MSFEMSVGLVWIWAAYILKLRTMFLYCWRICVVCISLELVGTWVALGFSVDMEAFGWALIVICSLELGILWCSQVLDLSLLPLVFSLILTVASRLIHPYSTNDKKKKSRLMEKRFSTVNDTQKGSLSYMEKRSGMREIKVTRARRGGTQNGRENLVSNQIAMCSPQPGTPREVHGVT